MALLSKEALLGASDLVEREVELPSIGGSVRVRSLPAAYSNQATSEALELVTGRRGEQTAKVNTAKLEILQVLHGLVDPKLSSMQEAEAFAQRCGPAFKEIVRVIDEISGVDKKALEDAEARFPAGGGEAAGEDVGAGDPARSSGPDLPVRVGA
ncbi:MAG TPA: hypothetical protein VK595_10610 [Vicinamibacterales bacterium]|nr:hypothetical protein [Vicinamibacterales bacterium]